jgi:hypothetical protein
MRVPSVRILPLANAPALLENILTIIGYPNPASDEVLIRLQESSQDTGITDIEIEIPTWKMFLLL